MQTIILGIVFFLAAFTALSVGVIFKGSFSKASCESAIGGEEDCVCGGDENECELVPQEPQVYQINIPEHLKNAGNNA